MKKLRVSLFMVLLCTLMLCSCGRNNGIVGNWQEKDGVEEFQFYKDGSCKVNRLVYGSNVKSYKITESGELTLYDQYGYLLETYYFVVKGNKLFLSVFEIDTNSDYYYIRK